jgi:2-oxoglutarate ferredoxin oxidoreductase subunit alpha
MRQFLMGNEILARAAFEAGAKAMFAYPITPVTEIFANWVKLIEGKERIGLQTEDEMAAGFAVLGAAFAGKMAFTATGGPGMILMQDPLAMAEAMRLPMVVYDGQRGGPSTGQVIYSQQEVNLSIFGGNGEGLRIVYSTSGLQDLYEYGKKVFEIAWKYRFPAILLYDGYQGKMKGEVNIPEESEEDDEKHFEPILTGNIRNTYNLEEELGDTVLKIKSEFDKVSSEIVEYEEYNYGNTDIYICAHGIVSAAAKKAINQLKEEGINVGLFRPITLSPFPIEKTRELISKNKRILLFESSLGQFFRLMLSQAEISTENIKTFFKPGVGFTPEEIFIAVKEELKNGNH